MPPRKYLSRTRFAQINPFELFMPFQKLGIKNLILRKILLSFVLIV